MRWVGSSEFCRKIVKKRSFSLYIAVYYIIYIESDLVVLFSFAVRFIFIRGSFAVRFIFVLFSFYFHSRFVLFSFYFRFIFIRGSLMVCHWPYFYWVLWHFWASRKPFTRPLFYEGSTRSCAIFLIAFKNRSPSQQDWNMRLNAYRSGYTRPWTSEM